MEYRHDHDKLLEVRAETVARSGVGAFLHLLEDSDNISAWATKAYRAQVLDRPDVHTHVVHTWFRATWPVSKRDMVTRSHWQVDATSGELVMQVSDAGDTVPPDKAHVRMQRVQAQWTLTPLPDGRLKIRYQGSADAAGKLPHFLGDAVALRSLLTTFQRLPKVLREHQRPYPGID